MCICKVRTINCLSSVHCRWGITARVNGHLSPYSFKNDHIETCCPTPVVRSLIHCTFPCHGFLALPATGFVPLFAVHLATSAPFTWPNVCSVHLAMSTCLALSNQCCLWAFPAKEERRQFASSATNCCSWTQTRPRGSAAKLLSIYLKWLPLLYRSRAQTSVALAQP